MYEERNGGEKKGKDVMNKTWCDREEGGGGKGAGAVRKGKGKMKERLELWNRECGMERGWVDKGKV